MARQPRIRNSKVLLPTITLTPLIDTVLVLLIVFMLTGPVRVPSIANKQSHDAVASEPAYKEDDYKVAFVTIGSNNSIGVNGTVVALPVLSRTLREALEMSPVRLVVIKADQQASQKLVYNIVECARAIKGARILFD